MKNKCFGCNRIGKTFLLTKKITCPLLQWKKTPNKFMKYWECEHLYVYIDNNYCSKCETCVIVSPTDKRYLLQLMDIIEWEKHCIPDKNEFTCFLTN